MRLRLALCSVASQNVDPLKELAFDRSIPLEYRTYVDIIAGKVSVSSLGY